MHQTHHTLCEEMESQAIASVCRTFGVPFLAIKDISNNELHDDTPSALLDVSEELGYRASIVVASTILALLPGRTKL